MGDQFGQGLLVAPAVHGLQHLSGSVLQGQIDVFQNLRLIGHHIQQFVGDGIGIAVQQAHPAELFNLAQPAQQLRQLQFAVQVQTIAAGVLGNDNELFCAVVHQLLGLFHNALHGTAAVAAADEGNGAVGAAVVAALRDFQIGKVAGGRQFTVAAQGHFLLFGEHLLNLAFHDFADNVGNFAVGADAHHSVHLGNLLADFLLIALGKTSGDHDFFDAALFFQGYQLEDFLDGFGFCTLNKAAGVDNGHIGQRCVVAELIACVFQGSHEHFPVYLIFGTA